MATLLPTQTDAEATRDGNFRKLLVARTFVALNILHDDEVAPEALAPLEQIIDEAVVSRDTVASPTPVA